VLAKSNRVVRAADFRATMRKGRRVTTPHAVLYFAARSAGEESRFGFVVAKTVGGSVTRNLMRRRLRAVAQEVVVAGSTATDVVVRPLPGSEKLDWASLHQEILQGIEKGTRR
jgi:ribonuclease P protein component